MSLIPPGLKIQQLPPYLSAIPCSILLILLLAAASSKAAPDPISQIRAVLDAQAAAWNRGDLDGYMNGYARDAATEFMGSDSLTRGWKTVRDRYAKKYSNREKMGRLTFSEVKITPVSLDAALVTGRWKLTRKSDTPHGRFTLLFRQRSEGWRIVHDHSSTAGE